MTITLRPEQEKVIQEAIEAGMYNSVDEVLDSALESIREREAFHPALTRLQIAGRRIRELRKAGISNKINRRCTPMHADRKQSYSRPIPLLYGRLQT